MWSLVEILNAKPYKLINSKYERTYLTLLRRCVLVRREAKGRMKHTKDSTRKPSGTRYSRRASGVCRGAAGGLSWNGTRANRFN